MTSITPVVSTRRKANLPQDLRPKINTELIDKLLTFTTFDDNYWKSGEPCYNTINNAYFGVFNREAIEVRQYLEKQDPKNSWVQYLLSRLLHRNDPEKLIHLKKAADLGNPHAMFTLAINYHGSIVGKAELIFKAANLGHHEAIVRYLEYELQEDKVDLKKLEPYIKKIEETKDPEFLINIYGKLNSIFPEQGWYTKLIEAISDSYYDEEKIIEKCPDVLLSLVDKYLKLEKEHEELKRSYEELKKIKEMDFNNIVSSGVGEFLR